VLSTPTTADAGHASDVATDREQWQKERRVSDDSDRLLRDLEEVRALERAKRQHDISTPTFHELAEKITDKAHEVFRAAYREEVDGNRVDTTDESIDEVAGADRGHEQRR
jgi:hypothetical protein